MSANLPLNVAAPGRPIALDHPLPSGQTALSVAVSGPAILAIDTRNKVFFSRDNGKHWIAVAAPWQGHAVHVELAVADRAMHGATFALAAGRVQTFSDEAPPSPAASGSLTGIVTDPSGAAISSATITLSETATHAEHTLATDASGRYLATNLAPGSYTLGAEAPGFRQWHIDGIAVENTKQSVENITLEVGAAAETVEVGTDSTVASRARDAKSNSLKAAAATPPQPVFAITTDAGEHWTSTDGVTWNRQ